MDARADREVHACTHGYAIPQSGVWCLASDTFGKGASFLPSFLSFDGAIAYIAAYIFAYLPAVGILHAHDQSP